MLAITGKLGEVTVGGYTTGLLSFPILIRGKRIHRNIGANKK